MFHAVFRAETKNDGDAETKCRNDLQNQFSETFAEIKMEQMQKPIAEIIAEMAAIQKCKCRNDTRAVSHAVFCTEVRAGKIDTKRKAVCRNYFAEMKKGAVAEMFAETGLKEKRMISKWLAEINP